MTVASALIGKQYGRWTVVGDVQITPRGERKWLCRCACGTERYVLERSLLYGGSLSCGCFKKERALETLVYDLNGKNFGDLTVLHRAEHQRKNGGVWWTCQCTCGKECDYPATLLVNGRRTHCGCKTNPQYDYKNVAGQRFSRLTALYPIKTRRNGSVYWHCRCDCGNEVDVPYNELMYSNRQSCGCKKKEHDAELQENLTRVDGTSIDILRSKKIPSSNTTGVKGVYLIRGKYVAKIVFQKKQYFLGTYKTLEAAAEARKEAEEVIVAGTVQYYERWKQRAENDPVWANANPVRIRVDKSYGGEFSISFLPRLEDEAQLTSNSND